MRRRSFLVAPRSRTRGGSSSSVTPPSGRASRWPAPARVWAPCHVPCGRVPGRRRRSRPHCREHASRSHTRSPFPCQAPQAGLVTQATLEGLADGWEGAGADMRVYLTGPLCLEAGEHLLAESALPGPQGRHLLGFLVAEHARPLSRDELANEI